LDELRKASEMVPTKLPEALKDVEVASEAPTTAPPSKEPSPVLSFSLNGPAEIEEVALPSAEWPSLRESLNNGWDFCSEASDEVDQEIEKSVDTNWCLVTADAQSLAAASPTPEAFAVAKEGSVRLQQEPSFADRLRSSCEARAPPPVGGAPMPGLRAHPSRRRGATVDKSDNQQEESTCLYALSYRRDCREHGWKKQHKSSWNTKQQKKVAESVARRNENSFRSRGWLDEEEQC
jgi:hypothetical protein